MSPLWSYDREVRTGLAVLLGIFAAWCGHAVGGESAAPDALRIGLARVCITPEKPLWLHGYASQPRFRPFEGKLNDLYAKALAIQDARGERAVLITLDLCTIRATEANALFARLTERTGLERRQVLLNFSHTHSGPLIGASDLFRYPMSEEDRQATLAYTARLFDQLGEVARAALADLQPAEIAWGAGKCSFVRKRRLYSDDGSYRGMGPNADKPVDDTVPVLRVSSPGGKPRALVFGCACRAVTFGPENLKLSGNYPSFAQEAIEAAHPGVQAMFVQGCGADANSEPRCGPDAEKHARAQGQSLAAEVERVANGLLTPIRGPLRVAFREVDVPLKPVPPREDLVKMSGTLAHNAKRMLAALEQGEKLPTHHRHPLALWQFGGGLTVVGLSGEVVSGYVPLVTRALGPGRLWIAGYCNEVDGNVPDATIVAEGGYEARGLVADIGFYSADAEKVLVQAVADLARFCEMMLGEGRLGEIRVLSPESHGLMTRNLLAPPLPARGFGWDLDVNVLHRPTRLSKRAYGHSGHTGQSIWIDPEKQVYLIVLTNRNHPKFVGGARKNDQYRARARIGDAALASLGY